MLGTLGPWDQAGQLLRGARRCRFGKAEGGVGDVAQLDALLRGLQFSQKKADGEVWYMPLGGLMYHTTQTRMYLSSYEQQHESPCTKRYVEAMRHGRLWITGALGGAQLGRALAAAREGPHGARSGHAARRNGASVEPCKMTVHNDFVEICCAH